MGKYAPFGEYVAGNGLLSRRIFLEGALVAGTAGAATRTGVSGARAEPLDVPAWSKAPGSPFTPYGTPSNFESKVVRIWANPPNPPNAPGAGSARTPHQHLDGMITPSGLHFERHHSGIPDIDPDQHRLLIHGMVRRPLVFTLDNLSRYPRTSRIAFVECAGNSGALNAAQPLKATVQQIHGLLSCSDWTGVKLSTLLDEVGVDPAATWVIAEGADSSGMSRSFPVGKAVDDAMVCFYQNGERVRPSNGYPLRLLLPGFGGNLNVKWIRRLKLSREPQMAKDETSKYTVLLKDGKAWQFVFPLEVKSVITHPSPGHLLKGAGFYEISGLAWSGKGRIRQVEVSADGGKSWTPAILNDPVLPKALTRFRAAWRWNGGPAQLQSRATDDTGMVQPSRAQFIADRGPQGYFHFNAVQTWAIDEKGEASNAYV
jgi:sulfane dehydrogenase subunit SoxC